MPGVSVDTIIPATVFAHFRKVFAADADVSFSIANSGALALFSDGNTTLTSRVIEGRYPDFDRIIPTSIPAALLCRLPICYPLSASQSRLQNRTQTGLT
jgi:DNA polymerase III sliding clamp (beta) subunit (PCNA family)